MERRSTPTTFEVRAEGSQVRFYGYALKWNARSGNLGGFRERVAEGATTETIKTDDIRALWDHDSRLILGRSTSGTLRLSEDSEGLHYEVDAPDTSYARDLAEAMRRGDITQSSFGFRARRPDGDDWSEDDDGMPLRTLRAIQLFDVSPVTYPAYLDSTSGVDSRAFALLAERRGLDPAELADAEALRRAIRSASEPAVPRLTASASFRAREGDALALTLRAARLKRT